ncbi:MAG: type II secretion system major pseudopilin GspG [Planctomycetota bacterium]|nr:type II secretion system major pseudopilin GspG [Planctomycetota bacterium]
MIVANSPRRVSCGTPAGGFTLIELLLVMMIIAILAAIVVPKFTGRRRDAEITKAKQDISALKTALGAFEVDNGAFPTQDQGLAALATNPGNMSNWKGYIESVPMDPWGTPYIYRIPGGAGREYDLFSAGPDKQEGTADDINPAVNP